MLNKLPSNFAAKIRSSPLFRATRLLNKSDRKKILLVISIQISLGLLDLLGIAVFGVMGSLAVSGIQSQSPNGRVGQVLSFLQLADLPFQQQAAILAVLATSFLILRTFLTVVVTKRTMRFLCRRGAAISADLIAQLLSRSLLFIQQRTTQQTLFAVTQGVITITVGVIASCVTLVSDLSLLIVLSIGLFVVDPVIAISSTTLFGIITFIMVKSLQGRARTLGLADSTLQVKSNEKVLEVLNSYRESVVRDRRNYYAAEIGSLRFDLANTQAELGFMPYIGKYVLETTVVLGSLVIAGVQFALHDAVTAVSTLSIFLVAGTRISPAALRLQQAFIQIKSSLGGAEPTLNLVADLMGVDPDKREEVEIDFDHMNFEPVIKIQDVSFTYPGSHQKALKNVYLDIPSGSVTAFVGPSGGGKTTLVDVLLGVIRQDSGNAEISGMQPLDAIQLSPGAISYVPQDVIIIDGSIRENVGMGFPASYATDERVNRAIELAGLTEFVTSLRQGIDAEVGERGAKISGGQRQRLGIARALFTNPLLLVLDEATSALDGETEARISESILQLKGSVTVIMIAHRLSTVRDADQVVYLDGGTIVAKGNFQHVREAVPDFEKQAKLMGL
jgi:ABC-type multidrug transport system fused ATPase/permease subunit